jgi:hypothetical protein
VNLDQLNEKQLNLLIERKEQVRRKFIDLMNTPSFNNAISQGTGGINKVKIRFQEIEKLVAEVLG